MEIPGDTGEVAKDILDLIFLQLIKCWEFWKDDDRIAICPTAPWRHSKEVYENRSQVISNCLRGFWRVRLSPQMFLECQNNFQQKLLKLIHREKACELIKASSMNTKCTFWSEQFILLEFSYYFLSTKPYLHFSWAANLYR